MLPNQSDAQERIARKPTDSDPVAESTMGKSERSDEDDDSLTEDETREKNEGHRVGDTPQVGEDEPSTYGGSNCTFQGP